MAQSKLCSHVVASIGGIHRSASGDPLVASRHESFITTHLLGGMIALACLAAYLASSARADVVAAAALVWLAVPAALSVMLARTGRLALAHILSAAHHAVLVVFVAAFTGGVASFVVPWIVTVPIEAALSGSRRVIVGALAIALAALAILFCLDFAAVLPPAGPIRLSEPVLRIIGLVSAALYAGLLALAAQALARRSESAARDGTRHYRLMAENATDLISVHDASGDARFVSLGAGRLFGHEPADLMGARFIDAVSVGDRPAFLNAVMEAATKGRECAVEYRFARGGGSPASAWVETRCRPLHETGADPTGAVIAVTRDISEARAREDELRLARDEAEQASQAKSRFLANISHELRTPLNAIIGFSDVLAASLKGDTRRKRDREFVGLIGESGAHLLRVVNDLLDMSKIEAGRYEITPVDVALADLVKVCRATMGPAAEAAKVRIITQLARRQPHLIADARAMRQIILNLLSNAVKFSDEGGTVTIGARESDDEVEIFVNDEGIGIAEADLERLGEPFFQAEGDYDRTYEGTGLGLSVVRGLVELHRGRLEFDSAPGAGTRVTVRLPKNLRARPADGAKAAPSADEPAVAHG